MRISLCSYLNPCNAPTPTVSKRFKQLKCCHKVLVVITAIFASLATVFMGGLGGLAAFRSLVDRFNPEKPKFVDIPKQEAAAKTEIPIENHLEFCINATKKFLGDLLSPPKTDETLEIEIITLQNSEKNPPEKLVFNPTDNLLDFSMKLLAAYPVCSVETIFGGFFLSPNIMQTLFQLSGDIQYLTPLPYLIKKNNINKFTLHLEFIRAYYENLKDFTLKEGGDLHIFDRLNDTLTKSNIEIWHIFDKEKPKPIDPKNISEVIKEFEKLIDDFDLIVFQKNHRNPFFKRIIYFHLYPLKIFLFIFNQFANNPQNQILMKEELLESLKQYRNEIARNWSVNISKIVTDN